MRKVCEDGREIEGQEIIFLGIIDILVEYEFRKEAEHLLKSAFYGDKISVIPPADYAERFNNFVSGIITD